MSRTYYAQSDRPAQTMTVGQLIERLQSFDPNELAIFRSPSFGSFGSNTAYSIDGVERVVLGREELHNPGYEYESDDNGETITVEADTQIMHAWAGVVIS